MIFKQANQMSILKIGFVLFFLLSQITPVSAQPIKDTSQKNNIIQIFDSLLKTQSQNDSVYYGTIKLKTTPSDPKIRTFSNDSPSNKLTDSTILINAHVHLTGSVIDQISVSTQDGIYINKEPINLPLFYNLRHIRIKKDSSKTVASMFIKLYLLNTVGYNPRTSKIKDGKCILVGDVIDYIPSFTNKVFPGEKEFTLQPSDTNGMQLFGLPSFNWLIDLSTYTDILGLFGQANGLVQIYADANIPTNFGELPSSPITFLSSLKPHLQISRLDNKFQTYQSGKNYADDTTAANLFRTSYLKGGVDLNLVSFNFLKINYWNIFVGGEFMVSNLQLADSSKHTSTFVNFYSGFNFESRAYRNFSIMMDFKWYLLNKLIQQNSIIKQQSLNWTSSNFTLCFRPSVTSPSKIFLRFLYNNCYTIRGYDFNQLEIGYTTTLGQAAKK